MNLILKINYIHLGSHWQWADLPGTRSIIPAKIKFYYFFLQSLPGSGKIACVEKNRWKSTFGTKHQAAGFPIPPKPVFLLHKNPGSISGLDPLTAIWNMPPGVPMSFKSRSSIRCQKIMIRFPSIWFQVSATIRLPWSFNCSGPPHWYRKRISRTPSLKEVPTFFFIPANPFISGFPAMSLRC